MIVRGEGSDRKEEPADETTLILPGDIVKVSRLRPAAMSGAEEP